MKLLFLNEEDLKQCFDGNQLQIYMKKALLSYSSHQSTNFPRTVFSIEQNNKNPIGFMPSIDLIRDIFGYKVITVFHENSVNQLNPHQGIVALLNKKTGQLKCLLDGSFITAVRTAAVSAVATDKLSRVDSNKLAIIGTGRQAIEHVRAISNIRPIRSISVYARSTESFNYFEQNITNDNIKIERALTPQKAIISADIIVTCTPSKKSFFDISDLPLGVHLNAIGACRPGESEVGLHDHTNLKIYLDSFESCFIESDEVTVPIKNNFLSQNSIIGEIGDCLLGTVPGRTKAEDITVFKSVGLSIEDIYAAEYFYQTAIKSKKGQLINL